MTYRSLSALSVALLAGCASSNPTVAAPQGAGATASPATAAAAPAQATPAPAAPSGPSAADLEAASKVPPRVKGQNPFTGVHFYVNEYSPAAMAAQNLRASKPEDAKLLEKIAKEPTGVWIGEWSGDIETTVHNLGKATNAKGMVPVVVAYNIPNRDCGQYSAGGSKSTEGYKKWVHDFAKAAGSFRMIVVLEPDALGQLTQCLSAADQKERLGLLKEAIDTLEAAPNVSVYLDGGNAKWLPPKEMAKRLVEAGLADADGFALNVSNYVGNEETIAYGKAISAAAGGKHFIIDTSRNGNGATKDAQWCNADGRAIGSPPSATTSEPLVDAFFWVKPPGESDGTCNGGPKAGEFWVEAALGMAKRAKW